MLVALSLLGPPRTRLYPSSSKQSTYFHLGSSVTVGSWVRVGSGVGEGVPFDPSTLKTVIAEQLPQATLPLPLQGVSQLVATPVAGASFPHTHSAFKETQVC